jgi:very-short-patch-repair endonuclease/predicted transcriptional regulator of viral defense system
MGGATLQPSRSDGLWALVERQHGVVARCQLLEVGFSPKAIEHRIATGRLHPVSRGVYAIGRPKLTVHGLWTAAVLSCGPRAALSHESAAALWGIRAARGKEIHVSVPARVVRCRPGIVIHRRSALAAGEVTRRLGIPVTTPICTLVDLATRVDRGCLEAAINEADTRDLTDPQKLRSALDELPRRPGFRALRDLLDRRTFKLTDSELERRFLPLVRRAGLPTPETAQYVTGFNVDFHWPELGLVVETDGLRYHRTPAQQASDRVRDQAHAAAGVTPLRFTHAQVRFEQRHVQATLSAVARRLRANADR